MTRLIRFLKPYRLLIAASIVLLFVQAMSDLALPDYMSRIVNGGIQQGGVVNASPAAIRQAEMDRVLLFLSVGDRARAMGDYTLINGNSPDYPRYLVEYPALATEPVYVRRSVGSEELAWLDLAMGRGLLAVSGIRRITSDPAGAAALAQSLGADLPALPGGTDIFALLARLPDEQRRQMTALVDRQFESLGAKMVLQQAAAAVKAEYAALGMDTARLQSRYILDTGLVMLLISLLAAACTVAVGWLSARTGAGVARDLRRAVFTRVENFSGSEMDRFSTASLITRTTNDVTQLQMVVMMAMRMVAYAPIMGIGGTIRAINKSSSMWWLIALAVVVLIGMIVIIFSFTMPRFRIMQNLVDRLNLVSRENLAGMMVVRAFNRQDFELDRFDRANRELTATMLFVSRVMVIMPTFIGLLMSGLSLAITWVGAQQVAQSSMQVGDMMAFMQYAMQIVFSFMFMSMMLINLPRAAVSAGRVADVLEAEPSIVDPAEPAKLSEPFKGIVEFRNVAFRYPGAEENALSGISFTAWPGQTTAIIGATGSGKSTLVNLIPRFYDVTGGSIRLDGADIRSVTQHDLREKIGYVPQKASLFSGTIGSNLRYADAGASEETVRAAVDIAQAGEFVWARTEGLEAEISQGGTNVSGGQKQRLSIARALVKQAPIYIFDDSFSALDFRTDAALRRALREQAGSSTLLIVTQRVSTIMNAEQIIVLDDGKVVGQGTHRELLAGCETYREIASSQLSKEELA